MIIADYFNFSQKKFTSRLWIAVPLFVISFALTKVDFTILWRYFSWANQSTAVIALWVGAMYLFIAKKNYWIAMIPGIFMTMATTSYILNAQIGFGQSLTVSNIGAAIVTVAITVIFFNAAKKARANNVQLDEDISNYNKVA
jgi:carbon starvation protein CstA